MFSGALEISGIRPSKPGDLLDPNDFIADLTSPCNISVSIIVFDCS